MRLCYLHVFNTQESRETSFVSHGLTIIDPAGQGKLIVLADSSPRSL